MVVKTTNNCPLTVAACAEPTSLPPPVNLHNLDSVRREMGKVYRDMRSRKIETQDGTRLVYVLSELAKMFERCELEKRLEALEGGSNG
jgi:hypothetical protein